MSLVASELQSYLYMYVYMYVCVCVCVCVCDLRIRAKTRLMCDGVSRVYSNEHDDEANP